MSEGEWRGGAGIEHACNFLEPLPSKQEEKNRDDGRRLCLKIIGVGNMLTLHVWAPETSFPPPILKNLFWHFHGIQCWEGRNREILEAHWPDCLANP